QSPARKERSAVTVMSSCDARDVTHLRPSPCRPCLSPPCPRPSPPPPPPRAPPRPPRGCPTCRWGS
ncbi:unnamed protein product, partial [Closterium sp. NIES-54]